MAQTTLEQIVAADIGYGTCTLVNGEKKLVTYRSVVVKCDEAMANYKDATGYYLVGDEAVSICREQRKSTDTSFFFSEDFRILLLYGISLLGAKNPKLAIGLPNEYFESIKDKFKKHIYGLSEFMSNDQFNTIAVVRQPLGSVWAPGMLTVDGKKAKADAKTGMPVSLAGMTVVIDGGDGTTDICAFYKGKLAPDSDLGVSHGASNIHSMIKTQLSSKNAIDSATNIHDIDRAVREGVIFVNGKEVKIKDMPAYKKGVDLYASEIRDMIASKWNAFNKIECIVMTGGIVSIIGAKALAEKLKLPAPKVVVPEHPSQANAEGFLEYFLAFLKQKNLV